MKTKKPKTPEAVKISFQEGKGFVKMVGGRRFWLGHDQRIAADLASEIVKLWRIKKKLPDNTQWNDEELTLIASLKKAVYREK